MSKSTKIIAALGVVAGLGVAAMPLSSYATMSLDAQGYNADQAQVGIEVKIEDKISISADKSTTDTVKLNETTKSADTVLTVISNNSKGYHLAIKGSTDTTKGNTASDLVNLAGDTIPALRAAYGASTLAPFSTASAWGYRVSTAATNLDTTDATKATLDAFTADTTKYAGVTASDVNIIDTTKPTTNVGEKTTVTFAVNLNADQSTPAGTYNGVVTFTATNNAKPAES